MDGEFVRLIKDERLVSPGDRILVAVSGGADSVALLSLFCRNAGVLGVEILAAHLDHRIRRESAEDGRFVARLCADLGVGLVVGEADVPGLARSGREGLEAAGRRARRRFLLETADAHQCVWIALGHHCGDQAETFLHRLVRGTGGAGLAAMGMKSGRFIRPLLPFGRSRLLEFLAAAELAHVEDASNADLRFTRNRIRHELLPLLQTFNPRIGEQLVALSRRFALDEDYWRQQELQALEGIALLGGGGMVLDRVGLLALHPALRARVLRRALEHLKGDLLGVAARHLAAMDALLCGERPQGELHLPGVWVGRRYDRLLLRPGAPEAGGAYQLEISGPGRFLLPGGGSLEVSSSDRVGREGSDAVEFDGGVVPFPLTVRTFQPGDRFRPSGGCGSKKLKDFFVDHRIEREVRCRLPLLVGPEILWLVGLRRCDGYRPDSGCRQVVRVVYTDSYI